MKRKKIYLTVIVVLLTILVYPKICLSGESDGDLDGDGYTNLEEYNNGWDPTDPNSPPPLSVDTDNDGMPDSWEMQYGLNRHDPSDAAEDLDGDGYTNLEEYNNGWDPTDPNSPPPPPVDTDSDGMPDSWETQYGLDPNDSSDAAQDLDGDGYTNLEEYNGGWDPTNPNSPPPPSGWGQPLTTGYTKYVASFTLPESNIDYINLILYRSNQYGTIFIDDVSLRDITVVNLLQNPRFEDGAMSWGNANVIDGAGLNGTKALVDNSGYGIGQQQHIGSQLGRATLGVSLYSKTDDIARLGLCWRGYDVSGNYITRGTIEGGGINWKHYLNTFYWEHTAHFTLTDSRIDYITLYLYRANQEGTIYIDDVSLVDLNLIENPGFEAGKGNWVIHDGDDDVIDGEGVDGSIALVDNSRYQIGFQNHIGNNLGKTSFNVSVYAKSSDGATLGVYWIGYDSSGTHIAAQAIESGINWKQSLTSTYQKYTGTFTLTDSRIDYIYLALYRSNETGTIYIDEVSLLPEN